MTELQVLIPNATCANCLQPFRMIPHVINRKKREGKPTLCSLSCRNKYYDFGNVNNLHLYKPGNTPWNKGVSK